jgi:putative transposase
MHLEEMYHIEVSATLISKVTEAVIERVKQWQGRPLERLYPIVYLDALIVIIKTRGGFPNEEAALKSLFLALRQAAKKWTMPIHYWRKH